MSETTPPEDQGELLDPALDDQPETTDHPDDLTSEEAEAGQAMYKAVDDLDDDSTGLASVSGAGGDEHPVTLVSIASPEAMRRATIVKECMLRHGVPEVSIELQIGRPTSADRWNACKPVAVISHHIASTPTPTHPTPGLSLVKRGRSDLPGPLANGSAGVDLVYRILTLGLANHPGLGGSWTVRGPAGTYTVPHNVARPYVWGTEYEGGYSDAVWDKKYTNRRTGKTMTFREFMGRANAALVEAIWLINGHGKNPGNSDGLSGYHGEHKTWAPTRKIDRLHYTTDSGRAEIRKFNAASPAKPDTRPVVDLSRMIEISKKFAEHGPSTDLTGGGIRTVAKALTKKGFMPDGDVVGVWGWRDRAAYSRLQKAYGFTGADADGVVGETSLRRLGDEAGFRVV